MKKLYLILLMSIFLISFTYALEFDNSKSVLNVREGENYFIKDKEITYKEIWKEYSPIRIKNTFGIGKTLFDGAIVEHDESCYSGCESIIEVYLGEESVLVSDIFFYKVNRLNTERKLLDNFNYDLEIKIGNEWKSYKVGQELPQGYYLLKINGYKKPTESIDWVIETQGKTLDSWANWWNNDRNLEIYWDFDEIVSGEWVDSSGNSRNLTNSGLVLNTTDAVLNHSAYTGLTTINRGNLTNYAHSDVNSFSISLWAKTLNTNANNNYIFQQSGTGGYLMGFGAGGSNELFVGSSSSIWTTNYSRQDGQFHHLVYTLNSTTQTLYVDGTKYIENTTLVASIPSGFKNWSFGEALDNSPRSLNGNLDELGIWNITLSADDVSDLYNSGNGLRQPSKVTLVSPSDSATVIGSSQGFNATFTSSFELQNSTLFLWYSNSSLINTNTTDVSGFSNSSLLYLDIPFADNLIWNDYVCDVSGQCGFSNSNRTLSRKTFTIEEEYFNANAYETDTETFQANVTIPTGTNSVVGTLFYNGTSKTTTTTSLNSTYYKLESTFDLATIVGSSQNHSFYWDVNITNNDGTFNSDTSSNLDYQLVNNITLALAGSSPLNVPYINFTFKDESTLLDIMANVSASTFTYWLGTGSVNKTLTYTNTSGSLSYAFAFNPSFKTLNVVPQLQYLATDYPQRIYSPTEIQLTNNTLNQTLYLLNSLDGLYAPYQVLSGAGQQLSGVSVNATREISGEDVLVATGTTDDTGLVTLWLNPNFQHSLTFSLEGFNSKTLSISPTSTTTTVTLDSTSSGGGAAIDYTNGVSISILPTDQFLTNQTSYDFVYNISSTFWALSEFGFNVSYENGTLISSDSDTSTGGGVLTINGNTKDSNKIIMNYYYITNSTTINYNTYWIVSKTSGYGISVFLSNLGTYIDSNIFGVLGDDNGNFAKAFLFSIIVVISMGVLSARYGITSEPFLMSILFGLVLLLDNVNLLPDPNLNAPVSFGTFLAILIGLITIAFVVREEFR